MLCENYYMSPNSFVIPFYHLLYSDFLKGRSWHYCMMFPTMKRHNKIILTICDFLFRRGTFNPLMCTSHYSGFYVIIVQTFARYLLYSISFAFRIHAIGISDTSFVQLQRRTFNTNGVTGRRKFSYTELYKQNTENEEKRYISINQSINSIRVHHATKALGHNMVQNSTMTTWEMNT